MGVRVRAELESLGAAVEVLPREVVGDILIGRWNADASGKPLLAVCHMDTVHLYGALERNPIRQEDGKLYGPASNDEKGGIATLLEAIRGLQDLKLFPARPLITLFNTDEETGSEHSRDVIKNLARSAGLALIMEPAMSDGSLKTWRKSAATFTVRAFGIAAHAGAAHESGLNAIEEIAHQVIALQKMTRYKVGTTVSVGVVNGGTTRNVIPEYAEIAIDARAATFEEMNRLTDEIHALKAVLPGARIEIEGGFDRPPMERTEAMMETFTLAAKIAARHGITLRESGTGGASDGNYTAGEGTPTLDGLGPIAEGAHSDKENCLISSLPVSAAQVAAIIAEWPAQ
jgi:glutamate carboxypeptidase